MVADALFSVVSLCLENGFYPMRIRTTEIIAENNRKIFFVVSCSRNKKYAVSAVIKIYNE